jgi:iron complex transport system ATP-binding protein
VSAPAAWRCTGVHFGYPAAERAAVDGVSLEVREGACTAVLGPNGSGKSTLLRLLLGTLRPESGEVRFRGRRVEQWPRTALARQIGVVPQGETVGFPMTARELVALGRYPHMGAWRPEGERDRRAIEQAMRRCDLAGMADRQLSTLSGGELQRARLARALAQESDTLALDEPTVALDIAHEMSIFELLRALGGDGVTVLLITHNINLAARYADRLVLLHRGRVEVEGTPQEVLTRESVERVYGWPVRVVAYPGPGPGTGAPQVLPLAAEPSRGAMRRSLLIATGMLTVVRVSFPERVSGAELRASTALYPLVGLGVAVAPAAALLLPLPALPRGTGAGPLGRRDRRAAPGRVGRLLRRRLRASPRGPRRHPRATARHPQGPARRHFRRRGGHPAAARQVDGPGARPLVRAPAGGAGGALEHGADPARAPRGAHHGAGGNLRRAGSPWDRHPSAGGRPGAAGGRAPPLAALGVGRLAGLVGGAVGIGAAALLVRRFGGVTGDVCGAAGEAAELAVLWALLPWEA